VGGRGNKIPCVILQKGGEFIFHGSPLIGVGIDKSSRIAWRHQEQQHGMVERRLTEPELATGDHGNAEVLAQFPEKEMTSAWWEPKMVT